MLKSFGKERAIPAKKFKTRGRKLLKQQLQKESRAVGMNSLRVLKKFERLEDDLPV